MLTQYKIRIKPFIAFFLLIFFHSCYNETTIDVVTDFSVEAKSDDYSVPASISFENKTTGANRYQWTFEGGEPFSSDKKDPGTIKYKQAGKYTIRLEAWNDYHNSFKEFELVLDSSATLLFDTEVLINQFVPADVRITNRTQGATAYEWHFEGGEPSSSNEKEPPLIRYNSPGEHEIRLIVEAGRKKRELIRKIILLPSLQPDFTLHPDFECEDMQAPWKGKLKNTTISGLTYTWKAPGGTLESDTATHTGVNYKNPGAYTLTLEAANGKQTLEKSVNITILPNTNLYHAENVKLGINTAKNIGAFYSCRLRKGIPENETDETNGKSIDFAFFGLNANFTYCLFLSPDKVQDYVFDPIPGATSTKFLSITGEPDITLSPEDFDAMKNDKVLKKLFIRERASDEAFFKAGMEFPRVVLFETADRRKGAIKIKQLVTDPAGSYITIDIKVQKESN